MCPHVTTPSVSACEELCALISLPPQSLHERSYVPSYHNPLSLCICSLSLCICTLISQPPQSLHVRSYVPSYHNPLSLCMRGAMYPHITTPSVSVCEELCTLISQPPQSLHARSYVPSYHNPLSLCMRGAMCPHVTTPSVSACEELCALMSLPPQSLHARSYVTSCHYPLSLCICSLSLCMRGAMCPHVTTPSVSVYVPSVSACEELCDLMSLPPQSLYMFPQSVHARSYVPSCHYPLSLCICSLSLCMRGAICPHVTSPSVSACEELCALISQPHQSLHVRSYVPSCHYPLSLCMRGAMCPHVTTPSVSACEELYALMSLPPSLCMRGAM